MTQISWSGAISIAIVGAVQSFIGDLQNIGHPDTVIIPTNMTDTLPLDGAGQKSYYGVRL